MGGVNPVAAGLARQFLDAVEPFLLQLRHEQAERLAAFQESLGAYVEAIVDRRLCERMIAQAVPLQACGLYTAGIHYRPGALATHRGGLWQARDDTQAEPGTGLDWRLIANGIADLSGSVDENDPRLMTFSMHLASGDQINLEHRLPLPLHRGRYEAGTEYQQGDEVALNGSSWRARETTMTSPPGSAWLLVAKTGERRRAEP